MKTNTFVGILVGIALTLLAVHALANHDTIPVLKDVGLAAGGECFFNKKGEMLKGGAISKPCLFGISKSTGNWYAIIQSETGLIVEVIEMGMATGKNKSVWRISPKGQLEV